MKALTHTRSSARCQQITEGPQTQHLTQLPSQRSLSHSLTFYTLSITLSFVFSFILCFSFFLSFFLSPPPLSICLSLPSPAPRLFLACCRLEKKKKKNVAMLNWNSNCALKLRLFPKLILCISKSLSKNTMRLCFTHSSPGKNSHLNALVLLWRGGVEWGE